MGKGSIALFRTIATTSPVWSAASLCPSRSVRFMPWRNGCKNGIILKFTITP